MRATISRAEVMAFARSLGADPEQVQKIELDGKVVTVTSYRLDEQGRRHLVNPPGFRKEGDPLDKVATDTTVIEVVGGGDSDKVAMRHRNLPGRVIDVPARAVGQHAVAGWEVATGDSDEPAPVAPAEPPATPEPNKQPEAPAPAEETPRGRRKPKEES